MSYNYFNIARFCHLFQVREDAKDVKVGTTIALMVGADEDWKNVEIPSSAGAPAGAPTPPSSAPSAPKKAPSGTPAKLK